MTKTSLQWGSVLKSSMNIISEAIKFATAAHDGQVRKLNNQPYIFHACEVGQLVSRLTEDDETVCAAILHDVIKDTKASNEEIKDIFGLRVFELINNNNLISLKDLKNCTDVEEKKIWLADKISNVSDMYAYYQKNGRALFDLFTNKDPLNYKHYFKEIANILKDEFENEPIYKEYLYMIDRMFEDSEWKLKF